MSAKKSSKQQAPQAAIDEFWVKFNSRTPGKALTILPDNFDAERAAGRSLEATEESAQTSYENARELCIAKVQKIVAECRRNNQKYRDPHFDLEFDLKFGRRDCLDTLSVSRSRVLSQSSLKPQSVKRVTDIFDEPKFYGDEDKPNATDVRQGRGGDCWLMAALCVLSNKPGLIEKCCVIRDEEIGVYGFVFYRDGEWRSVTIDDKLYLTKPDYDESYLERRLWEDRERADSEEAYRKIYQSNSGSLYFAQCEGPNETWLPLLEKAYAKAHGDYSAIDGGFTGEAIEDLCGGVTSEIYTTDILDKEKFWREILLEANQDHLLGCSTGFGGRGYGERKGIIEMHAYSVMTAYEGHGERLVKLRNPWGKGEWKGRWADGSSEWTPEWLKRLGHKFGDDGSFWISYADLLKKYCIFDMTRLFGSEWKTSCIWTSLQVPWTVCYHDTHFAFTLSKPGKVVLVLAQLDDRYFRGLEGQYKFELAFRLHRAGHADDIIRSQVLYRMTRSVNAEVELDAGEYEVQLRVDAIRNEDKAPPQNVLRRNVKSRRDKIMRVGNEYDLAHSKASNATRLQEKAAQRAARDQVRKELTEAKAKKKATCVRFKEFAEIITPKAESETVTGSNGTQSPGEDEKNLEPESQSSPPSPASSSPGGGTKIEDTAAKPTNGNRTDDEDDVASVSDVGSDAVELEMERRQQEAARDEQLKQAAAQLKIQLPELATDDTSAASDSQRILSQQLEIQRQLLQIQQQLNQQKTASAREADEEPDEFEKDAWNAVVVVGLRVYFKATDAGLAPMDEAVHLRVVRSARSINVSKGLDVDDNAKDATLEGTLEQRKKSIAPQEVQG
ncbi:hypothetical protein F5X68DRAFT_229634 [Plectosphaerella plurivora]|uniref:Calpain catalytic domain-containing protein n=1 Tax=Plectosphaerella plurivora TaxID=936078 RepID=A0A9P8VH79_9PEZI|nr:hypothetical protein F5X68DRAFT_229634 [Plectosphaerella plurivora]